MFAFARRAETLPLWLALAITACGEAKPVGRISTVPNGNICAKPALLSSNAQRNHAGTQPGDPSTANGENAVAPCPPIGPREDDDAHEPCPKDMKLVDTDYCPNIQRTCVEEEWSPQNKIVICHRFA